MRYAFLPAAESLPRVFDSVQAANGLEDLAERARRAGPETIEAIAHLIDEPAGRRLLETVFGNSPFLGNCILADPAGFLTLLIEGPDRRIAALLEQTRAAAFAEDARTAGIALRQARRHCALTVALADIAGTWPLEQVTGALSGFASAAIDAGLGLLLRRLHQRQELALPDPERPTEGCGYLVLGMGKLGAGELNYSSDVDLIVFYDPDRIDCRSKRGTAETMTRLTRDLVQLLEERTAEGYVCRTDLRLRPDPGAMPVAMSFGAAMTYYESLGQNWERAAMIKARPVAGDRDLGDLFLREIRPFVWRKHLDFWAIRDIHSIKRQIAAHKGGNHIAVEGHNVKLGRGGIREIEFFAQTQQLIFGGRNPELRKPQTLVALDGLVQFGRVKPETAEDLNKAYRYLRRLEHRLQMIGDQQTHLIPGDAEGVERVAAFLGTSDSTAFRQELVNHLERVEQHYAELFEEAPSLSGPGNLVFTGGEPEPGTLETLAKLGFADGTRVFNLVRAWHHGRYRATRTTRAREYLTELMPSLLQALGRTAQPDDALLRLDTFLAGLPAGVQLFSMLHENPKLLDLLAEIMGDAPALAQHLGRRPSLLESVVEPGFGDALPDAAGLAAELEEALGQARDFQETLDLVRRWAGDRRFQVGLRILRGDCDVTGAGRSYTAIAEATLRALLPRVQAELARQHGEMSGRGLAVLALGKLGAREMTATSDLDLVFVYEVATGTRESSGPKPLDPSIYFGRLSQRLITALTVQTAEGSLYEVDPRLRPSGATGPIAVSLAGYRRYLDEDAWTWEEMALTRARPIAGDPGLAADLKRTIQSVLTRPRDREKTLIDVAEMRRRIDKEHPARGLWDLKYLRGGLYDLDFLAQGLQLLSGQDSPAVLKTSTVEALEALGLAEVIGPHRSTGLIEAERLLSALQQVLRLTAGETFDEQQAPEGQKRALARFAGKADFGLLRDDLMAAVERVCESYAELIEEPARVLIAQRDAVVDAKGFKGSEGQKP
ncbi:bifunctional [glutamine synthetase] adenylyltransferase/[glutamine synthetase]-adenylyl-L-tyrosine phosphorylase [Algihabitans albus]|uniref:bifunctional [glutamine synthetase] adenylyltransferase/[glutamine synthetase]-adenylyl-L-tyrosine phosphorylase n=1 Tax=Algihabitans albus TaxID=2164067 RepID=UPI000E5D27D3|nr:bifunctional [glutamine synthetase] adenylyltransferase/[glutamine synthetase]-adenylyl-L-tyrosine phosphorylase [Algihabitans albus]